MARCFCCNRVIEVETGDNPMVIPAAYGAIIFRATGNYGSTIFDPLPIRKEEILQIIICDDCVRKNGATLIRNIKRTVTADTELFEQ